MLYLTHSSRGSRMISSCVTVFATNRIGFSVGYHYRYIWFTNYRGVGEKEFKLVPWFGERTNSAIVMGFYTF